MRCCDCMLVFVGFFRLISFGGPGDSPEVFIAVGVALQPGDACICCQRTCPTLS